MPRSAENRERDSQALLAMNATRNSRRVLLAGTVLIGCVAGCDRSAPPAAPTTQAAFAGSASCRTCHQAFYEKWATSWHGLAMREFTPAVARESVTPQPDPLTINDRSYRFVRTDDGGAVVERDPDAEKRYAIRYVLGGKNVMYFLTPFKRGRLQVLPIAYDTHRQEWYATTHSMLRHFAENPDEPLHWTERELTFNTSCYSCHVSQFAKNYDPASDSYATTWTEPGINCETCHGSAVDHVRAFQAAGDNPPDDIQIISAQRMSRTQINALCAPCHAKMTPLTKSFTPGDAFFDHYDLVTLEDRDFYPDGRDLGENFTETLWRISPCVQSGQLDCMHCHTSSGRFRFAGNQSDNACAPCHSRYVNDPEPHTFHPADSEGSRCVTCHMPKTWFARMKRHDHTMLPPTPTATARFESPNACNICHTDESTAWAQMWVKTWYGDDYEKPVLQRAELIDAARKQDWSRLSAMLDYLASPERNEVYTTSLIRLLATCDDARKWPALLAAANDASPLVRGAAVSALDRCPVPEAATVLVHAAADPVRLVRIRAAYALSARPSLDLAPQDRRRVAAAEAEYEASMLAVPDSAAYRYNLGNYYQNQQRPRDALRMYEDAMRLDARFTPAFVNASLVYDALGKPRQAENALRHAIDVEPQSAPARFNLGLLLAHQNNRPEAEKQLREALRLDPQFAAAAFNLGVLLAKDDPDEALTLCARAAELRPDEPRYGWTYAYYLVQANRLDEAVRVLRGVIERHPSYEEAQTLLAMIEQQLGAR
jgi:tetratricopeptide (TPR) repeat protein